jgi:hypothetical protein
MNDNEDIRRPALHVGIGNRPVQRKCRGSPRWVIARYNPGVIDKAGIFTELTKRNAVGRQSQLPLLDMRDEFDRAVEFTHWKAVCDEHADQVRSEVIAVLSETFGREPHSAGGRWAVGILTLKRLRALHQLST